MTNFPFADGYLGGLCNAETPSGCLDDNAECKGSLCQCIVEFSDVNGTCKAGKLSVEDTKKTLLLSLFNMLATILQCVACLLEYHT